MPATCVRPSAVILSAESNSPDIRALNLAARTPTLTSVRFWPSRARQLSDWLDPNRPIRTLTLSDRLRAAKLAEWAPAHGHESSSRAVRFAAER